MNIHPEHPPESEDLWAPPDWTMEMSEDGGQHIALVKRRHVLMCRLSLAAPEADPEQAKRLLADKVRFWIRDYLQTRQQA